MDKNYLVTKSNYFIMNSSYDLSLEEQKIILTLASMVQPTDEEFKPYKFKISEFMDLLSVNTKTKYTDIPIITKDLMKKVFEIQEGKKTIQTAWLSGAVYEKGSGYVELIFSPYLKPYMLKLSNMFTQYKLSNVLSMKSKYSPRIYELLKCNEFKSQGFIEIEVSDLRKLLKAEDIYPLYADFKRKAIDKPQQELKKLTDISFEYKEIKTGKKVTSIRFQIFSQTKNKDVKNVFDEIAATSEGEIDLSDKLNEFIEKFKKSTGEIIHSLRLSELVKLRGINEVERLINQYIDNIDKLNKKVKQGNHAAYFYTCVKTVENMDFSKIKNQKNFVVPQASNFNQREYSEDEYNSVYENV